MPGRVALGSTEVSVTQPPRRSAPALNVKGLKGADRKAGLAALKQHRANKKAAKGRIRALNKEIKVAKAGARMNKRRSRFQREQLAMVKRVARHDRRVATFKHKAARAHLKNLKGQIRAHKQDIRSSARAIRQMRKTVKQRAKQRSGAGRRRTAMRAYHQSKKASNPMWLLHQVLKAMKKAARTKRSDGRNHGFTGVKKKGVTGLRGR